MWERGVCRRYTAISRMAREVWVGYERGDQAHPHTNTPDAFPARKVWGLLDNSCDDEMCLWWTGVGGCFGIRGSMYLL